MYLWTFVRFDVFYLDFVKLEAVWQWQEKSCPQVEVSKIDKLCLTVFVSHLKASQQQVSGIDLLNLCAGTSPPNDLHSFFLWNHALLSLVILSLHNTAFDWNVRIPVKSSIGKKQNLLVTKQAFFFSKQARERELDIRLFFFFLSYLQFTPAIRPCLQTLAIGLVAFGENYRRHQSGIGQHHLDLACH